MIKQVIVVRKDLNMPQGKMAAMVAHAAMSFLLERIGRPKELLPDQGLLKYEIFLHEEEASWLSEKDPNISYKNQIMMPKIVVSVKDEAELLAIEESCMAEDLITKRVYDCGHSHNPAGTMTCIAIGPDHEEKINAITGHLKIYR